MVSSSSVIFLGRFLYSLRVESEDYRVLDGRGRVASSFDRGAPEVPLSRVGREDQSGAEDKPYIEPWPAGLDNLTGKRELDRNSTSPKQSIDMSKQSVDMYWPAETFTNRLGRQSV